MRKISFILFLSCFLFSLKTQEAIQLNKSSDLYNISDQFNEKNLITYIKKTQIKYPDIVYAQAKLESGNFKSKLFKESNNLFGMKYIGCKSKSRKTTAISSNNDYSVYLTWKESVEDYLLWQQMFDNRTIATKQKYLQLLSKRYAEDPLYVFKIKRIIKQKYGH